MSSLDEARAHLAKARTFLQAATQNNDAALHDPAASNAVLSAINSKDAICLALTGRSGKADNHEQAVGELRATGPAGRQLATALGRILKLKSRSQYQAAAVSRSDATKAIEWAQRLFDAATEIVTSR